jgi:hypothetical protein
MNEKHARWGFIVNTTLLLACVPFLMDGDAVALIAAIFSLGGAAACWQLMHEG